MKKLYKTQPKKKISKITLDIDKCIDNIGNKFNMILIASARAREINRESKVIENNVQNPIITALKEIETGRIDATYISKVK